MQADDENITATTVETRRIEVERVVYVSQNHEDDDYPAPVLGEYPLAGDHDGED